MNSRRKILVIGYYGDGNTGDEAVLTSMRRGLAAGPWDLEWIVPAYGTDPRRLEAVGVTSFPFREIGSMLAAVEAAELVLLGGGGLLHDYLDPRPETMLTSEHFGLSYYCGVPWLAAQLGKPVMLYAVGVGPLLYPQSRDLVRQVASSARALTVRDSQSAAMLEELGCPPAEVTADPVWRLVRAERAASEALLAESGLNGGPWLGVAVRNWNAVRNWKIDADQELWEEQLLEGVASFARAHRLGVLFIPFQHASTGLQDDVGLGRRLAARLTGLRTGVLERPASPEEVAGVIGSCSLLVAMRLHSLIFACMTGTPFVALDYDPKIALHAGLLEPAPSVIPLRELTGQGLAEALERTWKNRDEHGRGGRTLAALMRVRAERNEALALRLLDEERTWMPRPSRQRILQAVTERAQASARETGVDHPAPRPRDYSAAGIPDSTPEASRPRRPIVRILTPAFFDASGQARVFGGAERYLTEFVAVIRGLGYDVEVIQRAEANSWVRYDRDLRVVGLDTQGDFFGLDHAVRMAGLCPALLTIHLAFQTAGPETPPGSIGISHGVYWDDPWYHTGSDFQWHRDRILQSLERLDLVVSVDTNTINWIRGESPALAEKLVYIPNFVDLARFRPNAARKESRRVILFPRRLVRAKGFWLISDILPGLLARYADLEFHFVGQARGEEEREIRELRARHPGRVLWSVVPPEGMPDVYRAADIVVIPTEHFEGTSLSCLEAQACGRPVIATAVGGLTDLVLSEFNGLLVEPSAAAIEGAIDRLLTDPSLGERLAKGALETVRSFGLERWRDRWTDLLSTYLPARPARRPRTPLTAFFPSSDGADVATMTCLWRIAEDLAQHGVDAFWIDRGDGRKSDLPRLQIVAPGEQLRLVAPLTFLPGEPAPSSQPVHPGVESPETIAIVAARPGHSPRRNPGLALAGGARFTIVFSSEAGSEEAGVLTDGSYLVTPTASSWLTALRPIVRTLLKERRGKSMNKDQPSMPRGVRSTHAEPELRNQEELALLRAKIAEREGLLVGLRAKAAEKEVQFRLLLLDRDQDHERLLRDRDQDHERLLRDRDQDHERLLRDRDQSHERLLRDRDQHIERLQRELSSATRELTGIHNSLLWRVASIYWAFRRGLVRAASRFGAGRPPSEVASATATRPQGQPDPSAVVPADSSRHDVVCLPVIDWDFRFQRPQQLMSRFAESGHRVFYVNQRFRPSGAPFEIRTKRQGVYEVSLRGPERNVYEDPLDAEACDALFESFDALRRELSLGATACVVELPFWWPLAQRMRSRFAWPVVYDCMDDHSGFSTNRPEMIEQEEALLSSADLVVASSKLLEQAAGRRNPKVLLLPNACDFDHFAGVGSSRNSRPVVGYYGAIADWFDADLVTQLARRRPDWDFTLVGSTFGGDTSRLAKLDNVSLPGERPYAEIPEWLEKFDVAILPFRRVPLTEATSPVKVFEILAGGKPLVSVPIPEVVPLAPLVRLASTPEQFEDEIAAALQESEPDVVAKRRAFARDNTWSRRFERLAPAVRTAFPRVSVVVITFNNLDLNRLCLESLYERTEWPNFEVIVVDNGSTDGTAAYLDEAQRRFPNLRLILNETNRGFAAANNAGLRVATGEYLALLNNDTVLARGWLTALVRHLSADPGIGLIGPSTNAIGNEAMISVGYERIEDMPRWAADYVREHDGELFEIRMLGMFCVVLRRATFEQIGPLDERFGIGMFEDDDYARRIRAAGGRIVCARDAFVHHWMRASFRKMPRREYQKLFARNKSLFEEKWGRAWTPHGQPESPEAGYGRP